MNRKPPKKSDMGKSWMKPRRDSRQIPRKKQEIPADSSFFGLVSFRNCLLKRENNQNCSGNEQEKRPKSYDLDLKLGYKDSNLE